MNKEFVIKKLSNAKTVAAKVAGKIRSAYQTEKVIHPAREPFTAQPRVCIVYLASPRSHIHTFDENQIIPKMDVLIASLKTVGEYLPQHPILIFHEDYTEEDKIKIKRESGITHITFTPIDFTVYKGRKQLDAWLKESPDTVPGRPAGYRMMCRFFSGVLQTHPALDGFEYYLRCDHDSFFIPPKKLDVIACIKKYNFDYLYRSTWTDHKGKESIWQFTKEYAQKNNLSLDGFKKLGMLNHKGEFNGLSPYNNFHISKISFWRKKEVRKYIQEIENVDGILKQHWQDTNVHSMVLGLFHATVLEKTDFGYRHNVHYSLAGSLRIEVRGDGSKSDWIPK